MDMMEFDRVLRDYGLVWSDAQIGVIFDRFDKSHTGSISFDEFLNEARGPMSSRRYNVVLTAFEVLDSTRSGEVAVSQLRSRYSPQQHPDVITGKRTATAMRLEFLATIETALGAEKSKVTPTEFVEYYRSVSASIDNDDYFEFLLLSAWRVPGIDSWSTAECSSTWRRVIAVHLDGRQTVETIKDEALTGTDDKAYLLSKLGTQGILDLVDVETPPPPPQTPGLRIRSWSETGSMDSPSGSPFRSLALSPSDPPFSPDSGGSCFSPDKCQTPPSPLLRKPSTRLSSTPL